MIPNLVIMFFEDRFVVFLFHVRHHHQLSVKEKMSCFKKLGDLTIHATRSCCVCFKKILISFFFFISLTISAIKESQRTGKFIVFVFSRILRSLLYRKGVRLKSLPTVLPRNFLPDETRCSRALTSILDHSLSPCPGKEESAASMARYA